jgi:hypothetical protein
MKHAFSLFVLAAVANAEVFGSSLEIESESAVFDPVANRIDFTISFNRAPDLFSADSLGRQADAFQYWIFYNNNPFQVPAVPELNALIRGGSIFVNGNLPIRNSSPPAVSDPHYGGWGDVRAAVPFALSGTTLTFSTDLAAIGDQDGSFAYRLDAYEFGSTRSTVFGGTDGPYLVPEPTSLVAWVAVAIARIAVARRRPIRMQTRAR